MFHFGNWFELQILGPLVLRSHQPTLFNSDSLELAAVDLFPCLCGAWTKYFRYIYIQNFPIIISWVISLNYFWSFPLCSIPTKCIYFLIDDHCKASRTRGVHRSNLRPFFYDKYHRLLYSNEYFSHLLIVISPSVLPPRIYIYLSFPVRK